MPARLAFGEPVPSKKPVEATTRSATVRSEGARADIPLGELLWPSRPTPLFDTADQDPYGHVRARGGARHWGVKAITALTSLAFVVLYGAAVLLHRQDDNATREEQATSRTAQGRVTTFGDQSNQAPTTAQTPTITAVAPSIPNPPPTAVPRPAQPSSSRSQNERASLSNSTTTDKQYSDRNRKLMSLALARAHSGLENNNLHMARSGVYWALSLQPNNGEAIKLKQDLLLRERARLQH